MGPTTIRWTSTAASDHTCSTLSIPRDCHAGPWSKLGNLAMARVVLAGKKRAGMNFGFTEEQQELRKMVKRFLDEKSPESEVRRLMATDDGYDPDVWRQMARELGLQGLGIPERFGGQGFGPVELYVVFEEMGAALLCAPYFSTVALAANAIMNVGSDEDQASYLPGIAGGDTIATLALTDDAGGWDLSATSTSAVRDGDGWAVSGVRNYVTDGSSATLLLVPATTEKGLSLFAIDGAAPGVTRESLP